MGPAQLDAGAGQDRGRGRSDELLRSILQPPRPGTDEGDGSLKREKR